MNNNQGHCCWPFTKALADGLFDLVYAYVLAIGRFTNGDTKLYFLAQCCVAQSCCMI